eukprot:gene33148-40106_t
MSDWQVSQPDSSPPTLLVQRLRTSTAVKMRDIISLDRKLQLAFKVFGFVFHDPLDNSFLNAIWLVWFYLSKLMVILFYIYFFYLMIAYNRFDTLKEPLGTVLLINFLYVVELFQSLTLLPAMYFVYRVMDSPCHSVEATLFSRELRVCVYFFSYCVISLLCFVVMAGIYNYRSNRMGDQYGPAALYFPLISIGGYANSCVLSAFLLIFCGNAGISRRMLEEARQQARDQTLSLDSITITRHELNMRYKDFYYINSLLALSSMLNVFGCIARVYISNGEVLGVLTALAFFSKEIPFIITMFYRAGVVNDLADELLQYL